MSRVIFSLINSVLGTDKQQYVIFHSNSTKDLEIVKAIGGEFLTFEKNNKDVNNILRLITDQEMSNNLSILPKFVINTDLHKYESARNLSQILRIPIFNILLTVENIKKEAVFNIANVLNKDINLVFDKKIAEKLYLTTCHLVNQVSDIPKIITEEYLRWKPVS